MSAEAPHLDPADRLDMYQHYSERWQHLEPERYVAPMAVRLMAIQHQTTGCDFEDFIRTVSSDIDLSVIAARSEMEARNAFLALMIAKHMTDATEIEKMARCLAEELAVAHSDEGLCRIRALLDRMVKRYWRFETRTQRKLSS